MLRNSTTHTITLLGALLLVLMALSASPAASRAQDPTAGTIALVGADSNIYLYDVSSGQTTPITTDADGATRAYLWPTWASDGRLAYFGVSAADGDAFDHAVFVRDTDGSIGRAYATEREIFTYAQWAPADCPDAAGCRELAVLYTNETGLAVRMVRADGELAVREVSVGGPHYWDWSPDGSRMFWARFGTNLEYYDTTTDRITPLPLVPGPGRAVDWSPVDDRVLMMAIGTDRRNQLTLVEDAVASIVVGGFAGPVSFAWSPQGDQVAYLDETDFQLAVVAVDGDKTPIEIDREVIAFWWSPDGGQIAYLVVAHAADSGQSAKGFLPQDQIGLRWVVYDVSTGRRLTYDTFAPTTQMIYYLNFYDQFSRSHALWSPDSRFLVFGQVLADGSEVVSLLDTTDQTQPAKTIRAGSLGIFSWP